MRGLKKRTVTRIGGMGLVPFSKNELSLLLEHAKYKPSSFS